MSVSSAGSSNTRHQGAGSSGSASVTAGNASGSGSSGFSGSVRVSAQPATSANTRKMGTFTISLSRTIPPAAAGTEMENVPIFLRMARLLRRPRLRLRRALGPTPRGDPAVEERDEEGSDRGREQHAADHAGADRVPARGTRAGAQGERRHAENERK